MFRFVFSINFSSGPNHMQTFILLTLVSFLAIRYLFFTKVFVNNLYIETMLDLPTEHCFDTRSTGRISAKGMQPLIEILESSEVLMRFDRERARSNGSLKFTSVRCIVQHLHRDQETYNDSYETAIMGRGRLLPLGVDSAQPSRVFVLCLNTSLRIFFSTPASTSLRQ